MVILTQSSVKMVPWYHKTVFICVISQFDIIKSHISPLFFVILYNLYNDIEHHQPSRIKSSRNKAGSGLKQRRRNHARNFIYFTSLDDPGISMTDEYGNKYFI